MDEIRFTLRLPIQLHRAIVRLAKRNHRSMNSEIIIAIERALDGNTISDSGIQNSQPQQLAQESVGQDD
ncbi:MAG: Arc family DNA-binding protein [Candidatus Altiarchaeales archaeon]|nr:Arc family DNA-binding protein [Candidatus Altiarchaeales archaeon]